MRPIFFLCVAMLATPAAADGRNSAVSVNGMGVAPSHPGATVHRFGSGAQVVRPDGRTATVAPFGSGVIVSEPGRDSVVCSPFGNGTICR